MGCRSSRLKDKEWEFLVVGLEGSGKTTFLHCIDEDNPAQEIEPDAMVNIHSSHYQEAKIKFWEIKGSSEGLRKMNNYFPHKDGVIFLLDGTNLAQYKENVKLLRSIAESPKLKGVPLMIYVNKKDLGVQISVQALTIDLKVLASKNPRLWAIHEVSCVTKEKIFMGIQQTLAFHSPSSVVSDKRKKHQGANNEARGSSGPIVENSNNSVNRV
jgi:small GTP-binding protein